MNWYIAKIVFKISSENTEHRPQFDEQLRLIAAESEEAAFLKHIHETDEAKSYIHCIHQKAIFLRIHTK